MSNAIISRNPTRFNAPHQRRVGSITHALPRPVGHDCYFDNVQAWIKRKLDAHEVEWFRSQCGKGGFAAHDEIARFDWRYCQRLELRQPHKKAVQRLATFKDILINDVEIAFDRSFEGSGDPQAVEQFFDRHNLKRYHGRQDVGHCTGNNGSRTRYTSQDPNVRNNIAAYCEPFCRRTGELHCLHLEWRAKRASTVRGHGIRSVTDLLNFDHQAFWQKNLLLRDIDLRKLGHLWNNHFEKTGRKKPRFKTNWQSEVYDFDLWTGLMLFRGAGSTVQKTVDEYKPILKDINRCLAPISLSLLEPMKRNRTLTYI